MKRSLLILQFILLTNAFAIDIRYVYEEHSRLLLAAISYKHDVPCQRIHFYYDEYERKVMVIADNGSSEDIFDQTDVKEQIVTSYKYHPASDDESYPVEIIEKIVDTITGGQKILMHTINFYNHTLNLMQKVVVDAEGNVVETRFDGSGRQTSTFERPTEGGMILMDYNYDKLGRIESISCQTEKGVNVIHYSYDESGKLVILRDRNQDESSQSSQDWASFVVSKCREYRTRFNSTFSSAKLRNFVHSRPVLREIKHNFEEFSKWFLGPTFFKLSGYYTYPARRGFYGNGEVNDKVRVTLISGILNFPEDQMETLELLSNYHGGVNIHYLFRACEGWTEAMFSGTFTKFGFVSSQAKDLANMWKQLIAEMGGTGGGGTIIHYAHSIGGTETDVAKSLMTPEELKMIRVYAIATATIIADRDFQKVVNYVSLRDGVSQGLDPLEYIWGMIDPDSNVVYVGTIFGWPIIDHVLTTESYSRVLEGLGKEFIEKYICEEDH